MKALTHVSVLAVIIVAIALGAAMLARNNDDGGPSNPFISAAEAHERIDPQYATAEVGFGIDMLQELIKQDPEKNVFISPASISLALCMTYNGASGKTREAMAKALHLTNVGLETTNASNAAMLANLSQPGPGVQISIANSLWGCDGIEFKPDFLDRNKQFYKAELTSLDFEDPNAPSAINNWVDKNTKGHIKDIVQQIPSDAILYLVNAVYFKGEWKDKFEKSNTTDRPFHLANGKTVQVPMMSRSGEYPYYQGEGFRAISLPYGEGRLSMLVFLPGEKTSLAEFAQTIDSEKWRAWQERFIESTGEIGLPRFKMEYEARGTMKTALTAMGMGVAFDEGKADFTGMADLDVPIWIGEVAHKTYLDVNEEGTEAAAATSVEMEAAGMPSQPFKMIVDRPFLIAIVDNETKAILFLGAIVDPSRCGVQG